jgi:hypothetical protein
MAKPLTESQRQELCRQYLAGVPTAQIAKTFGVSQSYPSQMAAKYNLPRRHSDELRQAVSEKASAARAERNAAKTARQIEVDPEREKPAPMNVNSVAEIRRLFGMGRKRTEIAALLRCPYRVVDAALA